MVTTILTFENCTEVLGSERLTHRVHIIEANGRAIDSGKPRNEPPVNLTILKLEPERRKTLTHKDQQR